MNKYRELLDRFYESEPMPLTADAAVRLLRFVEFLEKHEAAQPSASPLPNVEPIELQQIDHSTGEVKRMRGEIRRKS
jgi:hypothetical protein